MDRADVRLQGAGRPERHAFAVAAGVVPALFVHNLDVSRQVALFPEEGDVRLTLSMCVFKVFIYASSDDEPPASPNRSRSASLSR